MKINRAGELITKVIKSKKTGDLIIPTIIEYAEYIYTHPNDYEIVSKFETEAIETN